MKISKASTFALSLAERSLKHSSSKAKKHVNQYLHCAFRPYFHTKIPKPLRSLHKGPIVQNSFKP